MNFMMNFGQNPAIKPAAPRYKTETIKVAKNSRPTLLSRTSSNNVRPGSATKVADNRGRLAVPNLATGTGKKRKERETSGSRSVRKSPNLKVRRSPSQQPLRSDSEDDEDMVPPSSKRVARSASIEPDLKRNLRDQKAFSKADDDQSSECSMIHAADVMMTKRRTKTGEKLCDRKKDEGDVVFLRYPSVRRLERYQLISEGEVINHRAEELIIPYEEIKNIADIVADEYLTEDQAAEFKDEFDKSGNLIKEGIIRKIEKPGNKITKNLRDDEHRDKKCDKKKLKENLVEFRNAVGVYNEALNKLVENGSVAQNLNTMHPLSSKLLKMVLGQVYDRAVSPLVDSLKDYENGTDYVYGELNFPFISRILKEDTRMTHDQVFIDLGSGVGNVVLQAALQVGCESWGCEIMPNCRKLALAQKKEFSARCRAWGLSAGPVNLEEGDFMDNAKIYEAMGRADVILVNNQVFRPELNQKLMDLFLVLKEGCKVVSLKSFVPDGHVISRYNQENPINQFRVEKKSFARDEVSWQEKGGDYYVATKDSSIVANFKKSFEDRTTRGTQAR